MTTAFRCCRKRAAGAGGGGSVDPNALFATSDIKVAFDDAPRAGYVRCNGKTIGSSGSGATERAALDAQSLFIKLWPYANIAVSGGKGANALADFNAGKQLTLPNCAGRSLSGMDDLGNGAQGVLTASSVTTPSVIGGIGGFEKRTLVKANVPSYVLTGGAGNVAVSGTTGGMLANVAITITGSGNTGTESQTHTHNAADATNKAQAVSPGSGINNVWNGGSTSTATNTENQTHTHPFSFTADPKNIDHTHNVNSTGFATSVSIDSGGSSSPFVSLSPVMLFMIYIRL
jgi:hypothetical protein